MKQNSFDNLMIREPLFWNNKLTIPVVTDIELNVIKPILASKLNKLWHSRLPEIHWSNIVRNRYYVCFGASFNDVWIASAIWSSPVNQNFDIETFLELRRLAISGLCPKNTATWMLARMIKKIKKDFPLVKNLISYQDVDVHLGTIYKAANWFIDGETKFNSWAKSRIRNNDQSQSNKIRWKYIIKK